LPLDNLPKNMKKVIVLTDNNCIKDDYVVYNPENGYQEIQNMIKDAESNAQEDKKQRELVESRNQADAQIHTVRTDLAEVRDQLTAEQIEKIESAISALETAVKDTDQAAITTKINELMTASLPIFEAKSKAAEPKSADETKPADEGVVDAEFTEKK
jgi:molecular chaperone DnaK